MNNRWNLFIYRLWAPIYDATVNQFFLPGRQRAMEVLALQPGERVLIIGIGTGADLPLLPQGIEAVGIDLSPEMLAKARKKLPVNGCSVTLLEGDAQVLMVRQESFDAVILNLILSVVPDGRACLHAALQALKVGGRIVIFDKFQPDDTAASFLRKLINLFSRLFGTDITRKFGQIVTGIPCRIVRQEPSLLNGMYRVILVEKILQNRKSLAKSGRTFSTDRMERHQSNLINQRPISVPILFPMPGGSSTPGKSTTGKELSSAQTPNLSKLSR